MFGSGSGYLDDASGQLDVQNSSRIGSEVAQSEGQDTSMDEATPAPPDTAVEDSQTQQLLSSCDPSTPLQQPQIASAGRGESEVTVDVEKVWGDSMFCELSGKFSEERVTVSR